MEEETADGGEPSEQDNKAILIVQEQEPKIERARQKLENNGFNVWTTYSIEEALYYLEFGLNSNNGIIVFFLKK